MQQREIVKPNLPREVATCCRLIRKTWWKIHVYKSNTKYNSIYLKLPAGTRRIHISAFPTRAPVAVYDWIHEHWCRQCRDNHPDPVGRFLLPHCTSWTVHPVLCCLHDWRNGKYNFSEMPHILLFWTICGGLIQTFRLQNEINKWWMRQCFCGLEVIWTVKNTFSIHHQLRSKVWEEKFKFDWDEQKQQNNERFMKTKKRSVLLPILPLWSSSTKCCRPSLTMPWVTLTFVVPDPRSSNKKRYPSRISSAKKSEVSAAPLLYMIKPSGSFVLNWNWMVPEGWTSHWGARMCDASSVKVMGCDWTRSSHLLNVTSPWMSMRLWRLRARSVRSRLILSALYRTYKRHKNGQYTMILRKGNNIQWLRQEFVLSRDWHWWHVRFFSLPKSFNPPPPEVIGPRLRFSKWVPLSGSRYALTTVDTSGLVFS